MACLLLLLSEYLRQYEGCFCFLSWWGLSPHTITWAYTRHVHHMLGFPFGYISHHLLVCFFACTPREKSWWLSVLLNPEWIPQQITHCRPFIKAELAKDVGVVGAETKVAETHDKNSHCQNPGMSTTAKAGEGLLHSAIKASWTMPHHQAVWCSPGFKVASRQMCSICQRL